MLKVKYVSSNVLPQPFAEGWELFDRIARDVVLFRCETSFFASDRELVEFGESIIVKAEYLAVYPE